MYITPVQIGATVDVTDEAMALLDFVALAYAADPVRVGQLLLGLASAREARDLLVDHPGVDRPVDVIESAELELAGARDALTAELPDPFVVFALAETDCRRMAVRFHTAANLSVTAIAAAMRTTQVIPLPRQRTQEDAA